MKGLPTTAHDIPKATERMRRAYKSHWQSFVIFLWWIQATLTAKLLNHHFCWRNFVADIRTTQPCLIPAG